MYEEIAKELLLKAPELLSVMTERERAIIEMYYGIGCQKMDLKEIGEKVALSRERVYQLKCHVVRQLRLSAQFLNLEAIPLVTGDDILPKRELYSAEQCIPIVTNKTARYYLLDNTAVLDKPLQLISDAETFEFNQLEQLYLIKDKHTERHDWKQIQVDWMKFCMVVKYRQCRPFRELLHSTGDRILIKKVAGNDYASNYYWGASRIMYREKNYYIGCNTTGKLLMQLREDNGFLKYSLPEDLHLFGVNFSEYRW